LDATQFLISCRGHHAQTVLGVTRVVFELVIPGHCHDPLPEISGGKLTCIVEVSLFKTEHFSTFDGDGARRPVLAFVKTISF
jgi:hypothetical protein